MQLAYKVFDLKGNAVTTPFTFIATSSSLAWEGITPKFADIDLNSYNLCPEKVRKVIDADTMAIVPVHVYGNPCNVEAFDEIGREYNVKVLYDAAHAFGVKVHGQSVLSYGDASTLSFHATKVFHTVEGGAVVFKNSDDYERALLMSNFGISPKTLNIVDSGINTKMSEVHAAMGLAVLDDIDNIINHRVQMFLNYKEKLSKYALLPLWHDHSNLNGAYFPVTFESETISNAVYSSLLSNNITARRYFSPSLNNLDIFEYAEAPNSDSIAKRTLCLPLFFDMSMNDVEFICGHVVGSIGK
jgi:dTDP-4-amino-4,6-dideoxygalactose transaminase